jgi:uncharacterized protein YacL (UPF0231 family)
MLFLLESGGELNLKFSMKELEVGNWEQLPLLKNPPKLQNVDGISLSITEQ